MTDLATLAALVQTQRAQIEELQYALGVLQDKDEIQRLQFAYGFLLDNRMFREIADLFADEGAWIEIGGRGRYCGEERIHRFLLEVLGDGRWGLLKDEVINHVQQQMIITVAHDRQRAQARARAEVQGNSPPGTPTFLLADGIYENEYVREHGKWKILSVRVTMTFYAALDRPRDISDGARQHVVPTRHAQPADRQGTGAAVQPVPLYASHHRQSPAHAGIELRLGLALPLLLGPY
jgi:hypothetical protein